MKIVKILALSFMFLTVSIFTWGIPTKAMAEENEMVAQVKTKQVAPTKVDCKYVEEKGKDGKIIIKLIGKDCDEAVAKWEKLHEGKKVCCTCRREEGVWMCQGSCCKKVADFAAPRR